MNETKKVLLCGHTGSKNRGCEALVYSTKVCIDKSVNASIKALTFAKADDCAIGLNEKITLESYPTKSLPIKLLSVLERKFLKKGVWGASYLYKDILNKTPNDTFIFNIGGDTYCYQTPWISIALNMNAQKKDFKTVLWGCSIDERLDSSELLQEDINRYTYIVTRETLSYEILKRNYKNTDNLLLACDPAFQLPIEKTELPENFKVKNTIGINLSPMVMENDDAEDSMAYKNICCLIDYFINKTDMNVCLVPHVYGINPPMQDYVILKKLYDKYSNTNRIGIVNKELNCSQLKYIISNCRFFIGARTHSTIAAFSTEVPTLALSYSIKARGLAKDIMGSESEYSVSWEDLKSETQIRDIFINNILNREKELCLHLHKMMPEYKKTILNVTKEILNG